MRKGLQGHQGPRQAPEQTQRAQREVSPSIFLSKCKFVRVLLLINKQIHEEAVHLSLGRMRQEVWKAARAEETYEVASGEESSKLLEVEKTVPASAHT